MIREFLESQHPDMLHVLEEYVNRDSPSGEKALLDPLAERLRDRFSAIGGSADLIANASGGLHVSVRFDAAVPTRKPILVLGHYDTVWPAGAAAERPFRVAGDRALGPGIYDMKASLVMIEFAIAAVQASGLALGADLEVLITSDEEIGSPTSRMMIEEHSSRCECVLVLEPPLASGALKTARKGVGTFIIETDGKAAHAGVEPEAGVNAIVELCAQVQAAGSLADADAGTTLSVGSIVGGGPVNVVPAHARAEIDARAATLAEMKRIESRMAELVPSLAGARVRVLGGFHRPPMERTPAIARLFERVREIAAGIGLRLEEGSTGGGSDGNFTAALGIPTIDGLGAPGAGAHAETEFISIPGFLERAELLAHLLVNL